MIALPWILLIVFLFVLNRLANRIATLERKQSAIENELMILRQQASERAAHQSPATVTDETVATVTGASTPLVVDAPPFISSPGYILPKAEVIPPLAEEFSTELLQFPTIDEDELITATSAPLPIQPALTDMPLPPPVSGLNSENISSDVFHIPINQSIKPDKKQLDWELMIGGNLFTFLGAIVIVIAIALLLTFAYDQGWIHLSPYMRVFGGILLGVAFMLLGARMRSVGLTIFAQGLVGTGIATLFLVVYAGYSYYHLANFTLPWLMIIMLLITLLALWQSVHYDSQAIALLGLLGGVLAPIIVGSGDNSRISTPSIGYYIYVTFLLCELSAMQLIRLKWQVLSFSILGSSYLLFILPYSSRFPNSWIPIAFLFLYWLLFQITETLQGIRASGDGEKARSWRMNLNHLLFMVFLYAILKHWHFSYLNELMLLASLPPLIISLFAARFTNLRSELAAASLRAALIFLSVGLYFSFRHFPVVIIWSFIAGVLVFYGMKIRLPVLWKYALWLFSAAIVLLLLTPGAFATNKLHYLPVINIRSLAMLAMIFTLSLSSWRFTRDDEESDALWIAPLLQYLALLLGAMLLTLETLAVYFSISGGTEAVFQSANEMMVAVILVFYSLPLIWHGLRMASTPHQHIGLLTLFIGVWLVGYFGYEYEPINGYRLIFNLRAVPMLITALALLLQAKLFARERERYYIADIISGVMQVLSALLFFEVISVETSSFFYAAQLKSSFVAGYVRTTCQPMIWAMYAILLGRYAYSRRYLPLQISSFAVLLLSLLFISEALFVEISLTPFLATIPVRVIPELLVFSALLLHLKYLTAYKQMNWFKILHTTLILLTAIFGFMVISLECSAYFYRMLLTMTGGDNSAILYARNLCFAACWAVYACCWSWVGMRRNNKVVTVIGITTLMLAITWSAMQSLGEYRFDYFTIIYNWRSLPLLIVIIAVIFHCQLLRRYQLQHAAYSKLETVFRVVSVLLIFELLTMETIEYFTHRIMLAGFRTPAAFHLIELRRTTISVVWLLYSVALIVIGIWRSWREIRLIAIMLFLLSILQIALYYLVVPNLLYRIISLSGLGITLLFTSYLYHRYRAIILAPANSEASDDEGNASSGIEDNITGPPAE